MLNKTLFIKSIKLPIAIIISFIIALFLTVIPLPRWLSFLQPEWVVLLLICWVLQLPNKIGMTVALIVGFFLDALYNVPFGMHSLPLIFITYLMLKFQTRFKFFSFGQKILMIFFLMLFYEMSAFIYGLIIHHPLKFWYYLISAGIASLLSPVIAILLDVYVRKFNFET